MYDPPNTSDPNTNRQLKRWTIGPDDSGRRLDLFLAQRLGVSRQEVRRLLQSGAVAVDGRVTESRAGGREMALGALVEIRGFQRADLLEIIPQPELTLNILAAGDGWLVIDKPAGMPVHPLHENEKDTVLNAVAARYPAVQGVGEGGLRSGVVHRLDVSTSGTLAVALNQETWQLLRDAFQEHRTTKIYRAIVAGRLTGEGRESVHLVVARHKPARVSVVSPGTAVPGAVPGSRRCDLAWLAVETFAAATLIQVQLGTGFLHQIRATLAHLGHPVLGDALYGGSGEAAVWTGAARPMLHASQLVAGPASGQSPDPADFAACAAKLRGT